MSGPLVCGGLACGKPDAPSKTESGASATSRPADPQAKLRTQLEQLTQSPDHAWASAEISEGTLRLSGLAPDLESAEELRRTVAALEGVAGLAGGTEDEIKVARPYAITLRRDGQLITATGESPSLEMRKQLEAHARSKFAGVNFRGVQMVEAQPHPKWAAAVTTTIDALHLLEAGRAQFRENRIAVAGVLDASKRAAFERVQAQVPLPYAFDPVDLVPKAEAEACLQRVQAALQQVPPSFRGEQLTNAKALAPLAAELRTCPLGIELVAHTDNSHALAQRMPITEARAEALCAALQTDPAEDARPPRVVCSGQGANLPIADNRTAAGRKRNNRVEAKWRVQ